MPETEHLALSKTYFLFFILSISFEICAQVYPDATVDSLLRTGINYIVNQDYKSASKCFNELNNKYPSLPLGKIYLAANKIAEAYDYAQEFDETFIYEKLEAAKQQSKKLEEEDNENIWNQYFFALSEGYLSYFEALNNNWFSALSSGVNSISKFEQILEADENFYEAYIAIGTFEYWKSRKLEFVNWVPFANDTKDIGIDLLIVAIDSSSYNSHLAVNSLIWIYIDQKKYADAIEVAQSALEEFPQSRTFKWGMARAYEELNPLKSIELYKEILNSYPELKNSNYVNEITLKHIIAQQYAKIGDTQQAIKYCDEILSIKNIPPIVQEEMIDRLGRVKELKIELTSEN
jgi:tetratricopeptide (TPR) repeat protein